MGRLSHDSYIQHFSHPHQLQLTQSNNNNLLHQPPCSACKLQSSGWMYTCRPCNFTLHLSCTQMPQLITHPSHPSHPLTLRPIPAYPGGIFRCDGCGHRGQGFSYRCNACNFDLHILCASKPLQITHQAHPCQLFLAFCSPYQTKGFSCDICHKLGSHHWLYRCSRCEFDAHLDCAASNVIINDRATPMAQSQAQMQSQVQVQHYNSFPRGNQMRYVVNQNQNYQQYVHSQSMGGNMQQQQATVAPILTGNSLMNAAVHGFVDGAAQQVGQNFVQSLMTNGDNNTSDPGNSGGGLDIVASSFSVGDYNDYRDTQY